MRNRKINSTKPKLKDLHYLFKLNVKDNKLFLTHISNKTSMKGLRPSTALRPLCIPCLASLNENLAPIAATAQTDPSLTLWSQGYVTKDKGCPCISAKNIPFTVHQFKKRCNCQSFWAIDDIFPLSHKMTAIQWYNNTMEAIETILKRVMQLHNDRTGKKVTTRYSNGQLLEPRIKRKYAWVGIFKDGVTNNENFKS